MVWQKPYLNQIPRAPPRPQFFCVSTRLCTLQMRKVPLPVPECTISMTPTDLPLKSFVTDKRGVQIWAVGKKEYRPPSPAAIVVQMQQTTKPHPFPPPPACNVAFGATYWPKGGWDFFFFRGGCFTRPKISPWVQEARTKQKPPTKSPLLLPAVETTLTSSRSSAAVLCVFWHDATKKISLNTSLWFVFF